MSLNTYSGNFSADAALYIAKKTLSLAVKQMVLYDLCDKDSLQKMSGRTFQYTRYERLNLPQAVLTEGVTPGDTQMAITTVQAVMDQWGAVIPISDVAIDSTSHPVLQKAINLASMQVSETVDREVSKVLLTGTNVYFPAAVASRAGLGAGNKIDGPSVSKVIENLRDNGTMPYEGNLFVAAVDPFTEGDVLSNSDFVEAVKYGSFKRLYVGEIGEWKGARFVRSNTLPRIKLMTGASAATSATAGSLTPATTYDVKVSVVDAKTGFETFITATFSGTTGGAATSLDITLPALPAGATANSLYKVYAGASGGTLFLQASSVAVGTYNLKTIPVSGDVAQAAGPAGLRVHHAFFFGKESVACIKLNSLESFLTPAAPSDSDPLVQRRKVGWKTTFKTVITNDLFLARLEHVTTNG